MNFFRIAMVVLLTGLCLTGCGEKPASAPAPSTTQPAETKPKPAEPPLAPTVGLRFVTAQVEGTVLYDVPNTGSSPLQTNTTLIGGSSLLAQEESSAILLIKPERGVLQILPSSKLFIERVHSKVERGHGVSEIGVYVESGAALCRLNMRGPTSTFEARTPSVVAGCIGAQPAEFKVASDGSIWVNEGWVAAVAIDSRSGVQHLSGGQKLSPSGGVQSMPDEERTELKAAFDALREAQAVH